MIEIQGETAHIQYRFSLYSAGRRGTGTAGFAKQDTPTPAHWAAFCFASWADL